MCPEKAWNLISQQVIVPTWYMKHVFKDLRGSWRCLSFAKTKKKKYKSQAEVTRSLNLQRASARAAARNHHHHRQEGAPSTDKSRWMFKSFSALYCNSEKRFKAKDSFTKMKNLINSSFESREAALSPSSSMNELIPTIDFDLENALITTDSSDIASTGAPPSRRSSASFFYPPTPDTAYIAESGPLGNSPYQIAKHQRRKQRATVVREVKNSSTSSGGAGHGGGDAAGLSAQVRSKKGREKERDESSRSRLSTDNMSVSAVVTMGTASSTPCTARSISTAGWLENYDLMTESLSSWTSSEKASSVVDIQSCTPSQRSFSGPLPLGGGAPRRDLHLLHGAGHHKKPTGGHSFSQRPPSIASSVADYTDLPRRSVSSIPTTPHHHHHHHQLQLSNSNSLPHQAPHQPPRMVSTQKDFQEAIVDIILENDVNDLVDLEEFLQGYFKLNTLYQDIIQQFFNDLSNDLMHPHVSRAPTVFARLASHNAKSSISSSKANPKPSLGKTTSSKHTGSSTTTL